MPRDAFGSDDRPPSFRRVTGIIGRIGALDARLVAASPLTRRLILAATLIVMGHVGIREVPREYADLSALPGLSGLQRHDTYGPDTVADMYAAKVTLNNVRDMYTRREVAQTPREAELWTKEASSPYPPVMLLSTAALYAVGEATGIGFYGLVLGLACLFVALSLLYFSRTRWYLFPLLYLNFAYFGTRFFYVQDGTYLIMLVVVMAALLLSQRRRPVAHLLMAIAITMKLSPLYYVRNVGLMTRATAVTFITIIVAGLILPYFIFENYSYIYRFHSDLKGQHWYNLVGPLLVVVPFSVVLAYVEARLNFDIQDRIGWALVPFAMLLALKMNTARHLLFALLVPDKRGFRNLAAVIGLGLHTLMPSVVLMGSIVPIASGLLVLTMVYYLREIGWDTVRDDLRHPARTWQLVFTSGSSDDLGSRPANSGAA